MNRALALLVTLGALLVGCQNSASNAKDGAASSRASAETGPSGSYASARPVLARCTGCHGENPKEGYDLRTVESILKGGQDGPLVVPGDPDGSLLIKVLRAKDGKPQMPPNRPMSEAEIKVIEAWIKAGAKA